MITSVPLSFILDTTSLYSSLSRVPLPVSGSLTCMWAIAAPALAASIAAEAICSGVTGISGCFPTVSPAPVTAHEMMTFFFMMVLLKVWLNYYFSAIILY